MSFAARFFSILFLFFIFHFSFFISPASAQSPTQSQPIQTVSPASAQEVPHTLHNWTQNVMIEVMSSLVCQLTGIDPLRSNQSCLGVDLATGKMGFVSAEAQGKIGTGGAIGMMGNMLSMLYNPPAHGVDYFQNLAENFGITKPALAQQTGTGFEGLKPLLQLWTAFRNIVYLVFVIVFIAIGLAIMLRIKIDPRTVMTIQNQIPKIIIGILLVTFSYAIAGFLIDMMYVSMHLIYNIISGVPGIGNVLELSPAKLQGQTAISALGGMSDITGISNHIAFSVKNTIYSLLAFDNQASFMSIFTDVISATIGTYLGIITATAVKDSTPIVGALGGIFTGSAAGLASATTAKAAMIFIIPYLISFIVVFFAILFALFRLWFALIAAYVRILIDVVLAPFWIMGSLIPGSPINVGGWLRDLIANLAAFPAVIALFLLGQAFMRGFGVGDKLSTQFIPPLIGNPGDTKAIGAIIGFGIILITPNIVEILKTTLKAPKIDTGGIGKGLAAGVAFPMNIGKNIGGTMAGSEEAIMKETSAGKYDWGKRGIPKAIFSKFIGR